MSWWQEEKRVYIRIRNEDGFRPCKDWGVDDGLGDDEGLDMVVELGLIIVEQDQQVVKGLYIQLNKGGLKTFCLEPVSLKGSMCIGQAC